MPAIITVASLRTVLGVSVSLYSDAYLEGIIDSAEQVILPLLTANQNSVAAVYLQNNVAYLSLTELILYIFLHTSMNFHHYLKRVRLQPRHY